ncbi:MAG: threonine synthase [Bacteroidaceae bacterium]|nr:threonine synthase [Bacteroidaceae bacterium]
MRYFSTRDTKNDKSFFSLKEAAIKGLAPDGGLFMPEYIPQADMKIVEDLYKKSYSEMALYLAGLFFGDDIEPQKLEKAVKSAYDFPIRLNSLDENTNTLELFHGPTYAFKDFGARFMGQIMGILNDSDEVIVLTATSGDTGSAVANGFYNVKGVKVVVLYPADKISPLQESQMTTLHENIYPLKVNGTFDDCQRMVKSMFADENLRKKINITSANSINILRWIPQAFYYFYGVYAWKELTGEEAPEVVVPSGNYGNLTAGMLARKMGLPIKGFVAASNANDVIPEFLKSAEYHPRASVQTVANAMDVGAPSNYERMMSLCNNQIEELRKEMRGFSASDEKIIETIKAVDEKYNYLSCPHSAVGYAATKELGVEGFWLSTAHAAKFGEVTEKATGKKPELPEKMKKMLAAEKVFTKIEADNEELKKYLLGV